AMVRFGTNTQKSNEPAWQDVGANVLRMDSLYDASFHDWLKCEDNVSIIASYLQRIANEYPMDRIINALRWLVSSWRLESTAVIVRHITSDWAMPQNPPKPNTSTSFLMDASQTTLQSDPSVLAGEARRGVLVRELTKDWTCQQIAQLVGMLSLTFWSERSHLEAFLKTLVSDWDFCRLSSFFSYVSGQLGLDYRVKVSMLQQAARRNASRLSLKRARNGTGRTAKDSEQAVSRKENAELEEEESSKRARHESSEYTVVSTSGDGAAALADSNEHDNTASSTHSPAAIVADVTSDGRSVAPAVDSSASSDRNSSSSLAQVLAAEAAIASSSSAGVTAGSGCGEPSSPVRTGGASAPIARTATSLSARAFRSGHMPAPLCTGRSSSSHMRQPSAAMEAAATAGPATTPSSPAVPNAPASPPATASVHGCMASQPAETATSSMDIDADEIQSSSSSTDLASLSYTRSQSGQQQQQQQRRRSRNNTSGASSAPTNASSPLVAGTSPCSSEPTQQNLAAASSSSSSASATATASVSSAASASAAATSPSMSTRRPLTPQIASGVFIVAADSHHQSSPSLRRQHRHNRSYQRHECQQPLTPTHSTSSLSLMDGASARVASAQSGASSATSLPTRPAMRSHAASISTTTADSPSLLVTAASNASSPNSSASASHPQQQQQDLQHGQAQGQEFRARTASESELGQFDGPASTHLALPLPSESTTSSASLCGRTSAAPYDVLGIVMSTETEHHQLAGSSV
ncbi:hypothetical protein GGF40_003122, partial [Coemansia sp. RSA 1286]